MPTSGDFNDRPIKEDTAEQRIELVNDEMLGGQQPNVDPWNDEEYTIKEQKKIIRKVDVRLIFLLGLLLGANLLDRTNLGNTSIAG